jgi:hypothetical protein
MEIHWVFRSQQSVICKVLRELDELLPAYRMASTKAVERQNIRRAAAAIGLACYIGEYLANASRGPACGFGSGGPLNCCLTMWIWRMRSELEVDVRGGAPG